MTLLPNYPFIDQQEFSLICEVFAASFEEHATEHDEWRSVQFRTEVSSSSNCNQTGVIANWSQHTHCFLRVSKLISLPTTEQEQSNDILETERRDEILEDIDDEALPRETHRDPTENVFETQYDILLSPSYSVPVLYFCVREADGQLVTDLDRIYVLLVPELLRGQLRDVGVMGGISIAVSEKSI